jgi:hypothetical protein
MFSMAATTRTRFSILLGHESRYPAQVAYWLAHELGHIVLGHLSSSRAILDMDDPAKAGEGDDEERAADEFAMQLLTGVPQLEITASLENFTARELAVAATEAAPGLAIDPGILALCIGHGSGRWRQVFGALKIMSGDAPTRRPSSPQPKVGTLINQVAFRQLDWSSMSTDSIEYLQAVLTVG